MTRNKKRLFRKAFAFARKDSMELVDKVIEVNVFALWLSILLYGKNVTYTNILSEHLEPGFKYQVFSLSFIYDYTNV